MNWRSFGKRDVIFAKADAKAPGSWWATWAGNFELVANFG